MSIRHDSHSHHPCAMAPFVTRKNAGEVSGLHLLHVADQVTAGVGDLLSFSVWVLNSTHEVLTDVTVRLRSFTNGEMETLQYTTRPNTDALAGGILNPMRALNHALTYEVTSKDAIHGDLLISAIQVELTSPVHGPLIGESDAHVRIRVPSREEEQ